MCGRTLSPILRYKWKWKVSHGVAKIGPFCSRVCYVTYHSGPTHESWKGGRFKENGYVHLTLGHGKYRAEHIHVVETVLGRPLPKGATVHHVNGDKADNRKGNLLVCSNSYHTWLEQQMANAYKREHF